MGAQLATTGVVDLSSRKRLSRIPLYVALGCVLVSTLLCVPVAMKLDTDEMLAVAVAGYVLTPFVVAAMLIWTRRSDLRLSSGPDSNYYSRADARSTVKALSIVVALSFVPAVVHIWYIAGYVGSSMS